MNKIYSFIVRESRYGMVISTELIQVGAYGIDEAIPAAHRQFQSGSRGAIYQFQYAGSKSIDEYADMVREVEEPKKKYGEVKLNVKKATAGINEGDWATSALEEDSFEDQWGTRVVGATKESEDNLVKLLKDKGFVVYKKKKVV